MSDLITEIPSAGIIESAIDEMQHLDPRTVASLAKELHTASDSDGGNKDVVSGYVLGLMTAAVLREMQPPPPPRPVHDPALDLMTGSPDEDEH